MLHRAFKTILGCVGRPLASTKVSVPLLYAKEELSVNELKKIIKHNSIKFSVLHLYQKQNTSMSKRYNIDEGS